MGSLPRRTTITETKNAVTDTISNNARCFTTSVYLPDGCIICLYPKAAEYAIKPIAYGILSIVMSQEIFSDKPPKWADRTESSITVSLGGWPSRREVFRGCRSVVVRGLGMIALAAALYGGHRFSEPILAEMSQTKYITISDIPMFAGGVDVAFNDQSGEDLEDLLESEFNAVTFDEGGVVQMSRDQSQSLQLANARVVCHGIDSGEISADPMTLMAQAQKACESIDALGKTVPFGEYENEAAVSDFTARGSGLALEYGERVSVLNKVAGAIYDRLYPGKQNPTVTIIRN